MDDFASVASCSKRFVEFVISSETMSGSELEELVGFAGDVVETVGEQFLLGGSRRRRATSVWLVQSVGRPETQDRVDPGMPIEHHLEFLLERVRPVRDQLRLAGESGIKGILRIVQYLDGTEFQGHGFSLSQEWLSILGDIGGSIDIDQYVLLSAVDERTTAESVALVAALASECDWLMPLLQEHLDERNGAVLPREFLTEVARWAIRETIAGGADSSSKTPVLLDFFEEAVSRLNTQEVVELIAGSFLANLPLPGDPGSSLRQQLGPACLELLGVTGEQ